MARYKPAARKSGRTAPGVQAPAEHLSKSLGESAQQIWLAGIGAFGRAQSEGGKLFEALVKEGLNLEQQARKLTDGSADLVREAVEHRVGQARERVSGTWGQLEKVFEDRVHRALVTLGVPGRDDLATLSRQVETLTNELRRQRSAATAPGPAPTRTKKAPSKQAASKTTARRKLVVKPIPGPASGPGGRAAAARKSRR